MNDLDFYSTQSTFSDPGKNSYLLSKLPDSITELCNIVHGLVLQKDYTQKLYNFAAPKERKSEADLRFIEKILDRITEIDNSPLSKKRSPQNRLFGTCRDFALLLVSFLRHKHIPARLRFGFATYFNPKWYEDHVVSEYWSADQRKWILVDPELGEEEIRECNIKFSNTNIPRNKFLTSSVAWKMIRDRKVSGDLFGVPVIKIKGTWFVFASVVRDLTSLNKVELLPWDYTKFTDRNFKNLSDLNPEETGLIDKISELTLDVTKNLQKIISMYRNDSRLNGNNTLVSYTINGSITVSI